MLSYLYLLFCGREFVPFKVIMIHDEGFMRLFPVVKLSVSYAAVMVFCFHHLVNSILLFQMLHFSYCIGSFKPVATKNFDFCHLDLTSKLTKSFAAFYSLV